MTGAIKKTVGIHCKACNASLIDNEYGDVCFDPELCNACLAVVADLNKDLYKELDERAERIHARMLKGQASDEEIESV